MATVATYPQDDMPSPRRQNKKFTESVVSEQIIELPITSVTFEGGCQPREKTQEKIVDEYASLIASNVTLPPIRVVYDPDHDAYYCWDGYHRWAAHRKLALKTISAKVQTGTLRDAILLSCQANATHGLRRDESDVVRAVTRLLRDPEWRRWTSDRIAKECGGISPKLVQRIRSREGLDSLPDEKRVRVRVDKDGNEQEIVVRPAKQAPRPAAPTPKGVTANTKTGNTALITFLQELDEEGVKYERDLLTGLGTIQIVAKGIKTMYYVQSTIGPDEACLIAGKMIVLRTFLGNNYRIVIVGDPANDSRPYMKKLMDSLSGLEFRPVKP